MKYISGKLPILLSWVLPLAFLLPACKAQTTAQQDASQLPQALLWKIEGKDLKEPSYLFGTIHMINADDYFLPAGLEDAFADCDEVMFEIDLNEMSDMGSMMGLLMNLMMKDGMTLEKLLSPEEYREVSDYFEEMGLPMFMMGKVKPMFLAMIAEVNMDPASMNSDEMKSYEMELFDRANQEGKKVGGLETMAYQMSLFDSIPYREQAEILLDAVRGASPESDMFDQTVELYKQQNIEAMVTMISESGGNETTDYESILLHNRNYNWIPVIVKKMKSGPVFFAVGAGHLGGKEGVIRLLMKEGYQLDPVSVYQGGRVPKRT